MMSSMYYKAQAQPLAQQLEISVANVLQRIKNNIDLARMQSSFDNTKNLIENLTFDNSATD